MRAAIGACALMLSVACGGGVECTYQNPCDAGWQDGGPLPYDAGPQENLCWAPFLVVDCGHGDGVLNCAYNDCPALSTCFSACNAEKACDAGTLGPTGFDHCRTQCFMSYGYPAMGGQPATCH